MNKLISFLTGIAFAATIIGFMLLFIFVFVIRILNLEETPIMQISAYILVFGSLFFFLIGSINSIIQVIKNK